MSHPKIIDALTQRSKLWHRATSTVVRYDDGSRDDKATTRVRSALRKEAHKAGEHLVQMIAQHTQDNRPVHPTEIMRDGQIAYVLQWVKGDEARYVPPANFVEAEFCIAPSDRAERLRNELISQREAIMMEALERTQDEYAQLEDN